jgi:hypothetical protein
MDDGVQVAVNLASDIYKRFLTLGHDSATAERLTELIIRTSLEAVLIKGLPPTLTKEPPPAQ